MTTETMKFSEMRQIPEIVLYPLNVPVDDPVKDLIEEWFDDRYVNDNELFPRQFRRQLEKSFPQYCELLRIQPGFAAYDWLVEMYNETQRKTLRTPNLTESVAGSDTITHDTAVSIEETTTLSGADSTAGTGTITHTQDKARRETLSGSDTETHTGTDTHTIDLERTRGAEGSFGSDTQTPFTSTSTTTHPTITSRTSEAVDSITHSHDGAQDVHLEKTLPMSSEYQLGIPGEGLDFGLNNTPGSGGSSESISSLDWRSPSAQSEDNRASAAYSRSEQDPTKNYSENVQTFAGTDSVQTVESGKRVSEESETVTTQGTSDEITHDTTDTTAYGKISSTTETGTTDSELRNTLDTTTYGKVDSKEGSTTHTGTDATVSTSTRTTTGDDSTVTLQRYTGRNTAPAELLQKTLTFIRTSNAWDFLYGELNKCFMGVY